MRPNYFIKKCHPHISGITDSDRLNFSTTVSVSKRNTKSTQDHKTIK